LSLSGEKMGRMGEPLVAVIAGTRLGWAGVGLSDRGIQRATLFHRDRSACEAELAAFGAREADDPRAAEVRDRLTGYANAEGPLLDDYPVDLPRCTRMQGDAWLALRKVPYGETRSYGWLASEIGHPGKARPVGTMNGSNPIPLWLPCHRIIGADGSLVGFGGGLAMKRQLLELEGALPQRML
jgi:methylated-DNA-[protein]-cysteine S-methyltransferase